MEDSILKSTKTMLGIPEGLTAYDEDVMIHINSAFSVLYQLGIGTAAPISSDTDTWSSLGLTNPVLNMVKTYVFLKVKHTFDPPGTSYLLEASEKQITESEWRLRSFMEDSYG